MKVNKKEMKKIVMHLFSHQRAEEYFRLYRNLPTENTLERAVSQYIRDERNHNIDVSEFLTAVEECVEMISRCPSHIIGRKGVK